jgi:hypothetical protein
MGEALHMWPRDKMLKAGIQFYWIARLCQENRVPRLPSGLCTGDVKPPVTMRLDVSTSLPFYTEVAIANACLETYICAW